MAKQTINLGTPPTGVGGDTSRSGVAKLQANDDELYTFLGAADGTLTAEKAKAVMNIAGHAFYKTLAAAQAAQASLPANTVVEVTNDGTNNGTYQWDGTTLTKSAYDPLTQAKAYSNETKAPLENFNLGGNPDNLVEIKDAGGRLIAAWNLNAEFVTKLLTDGIIQSVETDDGKQVLMLGDGQEVDLYGATFTLDLSNPDNALQLTTKDSKILFKIPISGLDIDALLENIEQTNTVSLDLDALKNAFLVSSRDDGYPKTEVFGEYTLSETRRKLAAINAGDTEQLVITAIGNSWVDDQKNFVRNLTQSLKAKYGNAGAGFGAIERGFADNTEATITRSSSWTTVNGATSNSNIPSPAIISSSQSTAGAYVEVALLKGTATKAYLYALSNGAEVNVLKNGSLVKTITVSSTITDLGIELAATDKLRLVLVSGTFTIYGVELRNENKGVRINKCGAGSSRWSRWLFVDAEPWQSQIAHLGADLTILLEGVNGAGSYNAATEADYTEQMIGRVRAATKNTDILLVSPPITLATPTYSLADYQYALRGKVDTWKVCHINLQKAFGSTVSEYNDTGKAYFLSSDVNHPSDKGARVISATIQKIITL